MSAPARPADPERPESPCIGVCALDDDDRCLGCRRTRAEIALWTRMTPAQQWRLMRELAQRAPSA